MQKQFMGKGGGICAGTGQISDEQAADAFVKGFQKPNGNQ
jgi:hypothetical protein